jgi:hypothetical protein
VLFHPDPKSLANCSKMISYRIPSVIQCNFLMSPRSSTYNVAQN